ncbi:Uncharacterised protein [Mycobacteroides abscessus subsp. massiliense]|nr:Uncharacterised protein [Mycobacteroides abscessus subsp. massiliense]SKO40093.1 Uncharacterised protein [Mycobacteroides abscessus subsp. massiliense]SKY72296.1 Uncharacterised protein [Mycobacteroides abscessus subsp. massiliense]
MTTPDYGYPASWAPRHARERQEREAAGLSGQDSDAADTYPSSWIPRKGTKK